MSPFKKLFSLTKALAGIRVTLVLLALFITTATVRSQTNNSPTVSPPDTTTVADLYSDPNIQNTQQIQSRIQQLEATTGEDSVARGNLIEIYRQILQRTETAISNSNRGEVFRNSLQTAPDEIARIRALIAAPDNTPTAITPSLTFEQAQAELNQEQATLSGLQSRMTDLESRINTEESRPAMAQTQLAEARSILAQIEIARATPSPSADAPEMDLAQRMLLDSRYRARASEVQMLEQELLSHSIQVELLNATRDLTARQIAQSEARVNTLEAQVSDLRQAITTRALTDSEELLQEVADKHPLLQQQAEEINQLALETQQLGPSIDAAHRKLQETETQVTQIEADIEEVKRTLELGDITESVGAVLLELRRSLKSPRELERASQEITDERSAARLRQFRIERQLGQLSDVSSAAEVLVMATENIPADATDRESLVNEVTGLLTIKRRHLEDLTAAYRDYSEELIQLELNHTKLTNLTNEITLVLAENLLWIRNAAPLSWRNVPDLVHQAQELFRWDRWTEIFYGLRSDALLHWPLYSVFLMVQIALLISRKKIVHRLESHAAFIGKVREDKMAITVWALIMTLLIASPVAMLLEFAGWRISLVEHNFAIATGTALMVCGITFGILRFVRAVCRPSGLGEKHFRWNGNNLRLVRRHLMWLLPIATACSFLVAFTEALADPLYRHTLGRFGFLCLMAAIALFAYVLFNRNGGLVLNSGKGTPTWTIRTRPLWRPATYLLPLLLALLAGLGYYYMAVAFEYYLNQTLAIVLAAVGVYAFFYRWLMISQRQLAYKIAVEKRQALLKSREEEDEEDDQEPDPEDFMPEINVGEVGTQTVELLRMSVAFLLIFGLWFTWSEVLPAFRVLDNVELWDHQVVVDGQQELKAITLTNLVLSLAVIIVTILAARNMPGFLEIALLQRLPVDQGTRYATKTLTLYSIVSLGVVLAFNSIGIGWSSVQWLVAALTVGLGFGLQEIFGNFVSGLIILLERPIRVGDTVTVGSISGVVSKIQMRATTITDWNRKELIVPNKSFITGELVNWSLSDPLLRMDFAVGIAYGSDTTLAHKTLLKVCNEHPMVLDQPEPTAFFTGFGDNSLNFDVRVFVTETNNSARTRVVHDLHMAIDKAFREHDICIAFPQRDVHLDTLRPLDVRIQRVDNPKLPATPDETQPGQTTD